MMQCGARVDDERQVRSSVGNERDKAVYSARWCRSGGEGEETNLQGRLSFKRARRLCAASHTRDGAAGTWTKNTTAPDRAREKWAAAGWVLFMMPRLN
jgi:hypothetical protein